tara:strand:+ start:5034 stop:5564 length:531 start_codon:yes stop_codon:yes gene_type:complete
MSLDPMHDRELRIRIGQIERRLGDRKNDMSVDERHALETELREKRQERRSARGEKDEVCQSCSVMGGRKKTRRRKKAKRGKTAKRKRGKRGKTNKRGRKAKRHVTKKRRHNHKGGTNKDEEQQIEAQLAVAAELLRKQEQVIKMEQEKYHSLQHKLQKLRQQWKHSNTEAEQSERA